MRANKWGRVGRFLLKIDLRQFITTRTMHFLSIASSTTLRLQPFQKHAVSLRRGVLKQEIGMQLCDAGSTTSYVSRSMLKSTLALVILCLSYLTVGSQPGYSIPAFARKYGLPCLACHIGCAILNVFC
jgi:hypothetical protein